jgi:CubicO group peptidase (beta-lactamase class C family)
VAGPDRLHEPTAVTALLDLARRDIERGRLPACQVAIARDGELIAFESFGEADGETRFHAFSATKPIVASAIWLLIGDGLLDVSRPVCEYVPELATDGMDAVTVEQVLLHTAGFPTAPMDPVDGADPQRRRDQFARWRVEWAPGTRFVYHASSAHWVLADLIERLGGIDFRDFVEQRVCRPIGLPRVLGVDPGHDDGIAPLTAVAGESAERDELLRLFTDPAVRAAGVPGGGAILTAADLALFYQALLHNPGDLWRPDVLADATGTIRCTLPDPLLGAPVNRTIGLVVAGDDGLHALRYAGFGEGNSPASFGHAGAHMQIGWADPATGTSFAYLTNGLGDDQLREGVRGVRLAGAAAAL